jgi:single-strand DNA-binding protein
MNANNVVVLRGRVSSEPQVRELPSGSSVVNFDVSTIISGGAVTVPVVVDGAAVDCAIDDRVLVTGHVRRRFFRVGGITQSRTEVLGESVVRESKRRAVERELERARQLLA